MKQQQKMDSEEILMGEKINTRNNIDIEAETETQVAETPILSVVLTQAAAHPREAGELAKFPLTIAIGKHTGINKL